MLLSSQEKLLFRNGYERLAGIDEAGRGALFGPVTAAVVMIKKENLPFLKNFLKNWTPEFIRGRGRETILRLPLNKLRHPVIKDSKQLSEKRREEIFEAVRNIPYFEWHSASVSAKVIDRINVWQATVLAWRRCLKKISPQPDFLFIDGNLGLPRCPVEQKPVIGGDGKIFAVALASIIAKVTRDRLIRKLAQKYPAYDLARHKGYATKLHLERLKKIRPSLIHRKSFRPVFELLSFK